MKQAGDEDMICGERQCDVASKVVSKSWPCFVDKGPYESGFLFVGLFCLIISSLCFGLRFSEKF